MVLFGSIHRAKKLRQFMARRKQPRVRGTVEPAQPIQGPRESIFQLIWDSSVTHQRVNIYHWAHKCGSSGEKDVYGLTGDPKTSF